MSKKRPNHSRLPVPAIYILLCISGFVAGYTTHERFSEEQAHKPYQESREQVGYVPLTAVCFTPNKKCQTFLITQINKAKLSIFVQAYSFTDPEVATALVKAARRGVKVSAILDKSNAGNSKSAKDTIMANGIPTRFDYPAGIAHSKVMVIDQEILVTGSYNFSTAAYKRNVENLLVIQDKSLAERYLRNWKERWSLSREK